MTDQFTEADESNVHAVAYPPPPALDVEKYRQYVEDFDMTEEQKVELLQTLWSIVCTFVRAGFGVDSVQHCLPALKEISWEPQSDALEQNGNNQRSNGAATDVAEKEDQ